MGTRLTDTEASSNVAKHTRKRKKENFNMDFDYCAREDILLHGNGDIMICETVLKDVNLNGISQAQESQLLFYDEGIPLEEDGLTLEQMIEAIEKPVIFAEDEMTSTTIVTTSNTMNTDSDDGYQSSDKAVIPKILEPQSLFTTSTSPMNIDSDEDYQQEETSDESTDDEEYQPTPPPRRASRKPRVPKRPARYSTSGTSGESSESDTEYPTQNDANNNGIRQQRRKAPNIAHWLMSLVQSNDSAIGWTNNHPREFKILDQKRLAQMWGKRKNNPNMTYNNVARTMRFHYKKSKGQELEEVPKKLVYRFSKKFMASIRASSPLT